MLDEAKDRPVALIRNLAAGPVLVLAPHPDDETFSCGMAIAEAVVENIPEHIVVVTAGEASHPNSIAYRDARLKACRYLEFQNAVDELGGGGITFQVLNYPDRVNRGREKNRSHLGYMGRRSPTAITKRLPVLHGTLNPAMELCV